jgi:hypothetical protein
MRSIKIDKLQIALLITNLLIYFILSFQNFNIANHTKGDDCKSYLIPCKVCEAHNLYGTGSPFPDIYPLFLGAILSPFAFIPFWLLNYFSLLVNIFGLDTIYMSIIRVLCKESILILNIFFPLLLLRVIIKKRLNIKCINMII